MIQRRNPELYSLEMPHSCGHLNWTEGDWFFISLHALCPVLAVHVHCHNCQWQLMGRLCFSLLLLTIICRADAPKTKGRYPENNHDSDWPMKTRVGYGRKITGLKIQMSKSFINGIAGIWGAPPNASNFAANIWWLGPGGPRHQSVPFRGITTFEHCHFH